MCGLIESACCARRANGAQARRHAFCDTTFSNSHAARRRRGSVCCTRHRAASRSDPQLRQEQENETQPAHSSCSACSGAVAHIRRSRPLAHAHNHSRCPNISSAESILSEGPTTRAYPALSAGRACLTCRDHTRDRFCLCLLTSAPRRSRADRWPRPHPPPRAAVRCTSSLFQPRAYSGS